jgi:hypothetical protein
LPLASVAVQVTVVVPAEKVEPDSGLQITGQPSPMGEPSFVPPPHGQLSLALGVG